MTDKIPLAAVLGHPIAHSKSPALHGHWLKTHGIAGHYVPMDVSQADFRDVVRMLPKMGFVGVNVTIPHKLSALGIADLATDRATLIGAANTLIFRKDGKIHADNTDGYGFVSNIKQNVPNWDPTSGPAVVFGAGGAARAVIAALTECNVPEILLTNRTRAKAESLRVQMGSRVKVVDWVQAGNILEEATTVVNTTSLGMVGQPEMRVPLDGLKPGTLVNDLVYAPLETKLLATAQDAGCVCVDGLGMLLHQAVPAFERWFGIRPDVDEATRHAVLG